jgi:hypothetical protein
MSWFYPEDRRLNYRDAEAYFQALWDVMLALGVEDGHCKSYDPLTIEGDCAHSYVFDLHDGGRHHTTLSLKEICKSALQETVERIKQENSDNHKEQ